MILEKETYDKFGYYPSQLSHKSNKKILAQCKVCGKIREIYKFGYRDLCHECSNKTKEKRKILSDKAIERFKDPTQNPFYGKHHSKETKSKLSKAKIGKYCGEKGGNWKGGEIKINCKNCGIEFKSSRRIVNNSQNRFCSRKCYAIYRSKNLKKENHQNWKGGGIRYSCDMCGKEIFVPLYKFKDRDKHFCSMKCHGEWRSINQTGCNHPLWLGGKSFEPYCIKFNFNLKERVREFFDRKCYLCGKDEKENNQKLSVHHVNYNKMTCCNNIEPLFVPLCKSCHGITQNQRESWQEFFEISLVYLTDNKCYYTKEEMKKING